MKKALADVSLGLRNLAVVIDTALVELDQKPGLVEAIALLNGNISLLLARVEALESIVKTLSDTAVEAKDRFDQIEADLATVQEAVDDSTLNDAIDDRIGERFGEEADDWAEGKFGDTIDERIVDTLNRVKVTFEV